MPEWAPRDPAAESAVLSLRRDPQAPVFELPVTRGDGTVVRYLVSACVRVQDVVAASAAPGAAGGDEHVLSYGGRPLDAATELGASGVDAGASLTLTRASLVMVRVPRVATPGSPARAGYAAGGAPVAELVADLEGSASTLVADAVV